MLSGARAECSGPRIKIWRWTGAWESVTDSCLLATAPFCFIRSADNGGRLDTTNITRRPTPKGFTNIAQGNALGIMSPEPIRPERAILLLKSLTTMMLRLIGKLL